MLHQKYPPEKLQTMLIPREQWHPYPTAAERAAWEALPATARKAYIADGEEALRQGWVPLLATRYLEYARIGDRQNYETLYFARRGQVASLVLAECMEGKGRFLDEIVNGLWLICEESSWCIPAHVGVQRAGVGLPDTTEPIVDLFAAETSMLLAWTLYLLGDALDQVSPLVRPRLRREIQSRVLTPCLERDDFWWMGFVPRGLDRPSARLSRVNNWNPWINSNWLTSALLVEEDPARRLAAVAKSMRSIDNFLDPYPKDGGCDEGPSYWGRAGASLFDCLELLRSATAGGIDIYDEPLVKEIGRFIYRVQVADHYFLNFADAPAILTPPPYVVFRYGQRIGDPDMVALGAWLAHESDIWREKGEASRRRGRDSLGRTLPILFALEEIAAVQPRQPLPRDTWLPEIQVMAARDRAGSSQGLYVAAKGGHNAESHNHNDVGHFVVFRDGKPLIVDAGVETYSRKTFSPQRYEIWTMQSAYHSLPTIGGVMQAPGPEFAAREVSYQADDGAARFSLDIAGAYPPEAKLKSWRRTVSLQRGKEVQVVDRYELAGPVPEITLSLLTPCQVKLGQAGRILLAEAPLAEGRVSGQGEITYDAKLAVSAEEIAITDARLKQIWGDRLTRLLFRAVNPPLQDSWTLHIK